ncbi:MAG: PTS glucose transporter subunit IIA [Clostridia bacterium]|nr:PTS glucose transporter subunit IIA [Clostridia bacterium]
MMKLFGRAKTKMYTITSCVSGTVVPMEEIADDVFRDGILGFCVGIEPDDGKIYAPCDGVVTQVSETSHAIGIKTDYGAEILIHAGIDTVQMMGDGFSPKTSEGDRVSSGQLLLEFDPGKVREAGYGTTVITAVTNSGQFGDVMRASSGKTSVGEAIVQIRK